MQTINIPIIKGDKMDSQVDYRDALPVNMYAVSRQIFSTEGYMVQERGLELCCEGVSVDRGGIWNENFNKHFRISGNKLIEINSNQTITEIGDISGNLQTSLPYSFSSQAVVANGNYWLWKPDTGLVQVTDPDLGSPIDCCWINNYYFFTDGNYIYHTDIDNEASIDPLKFATAEFMPDPSLAVGKTQDNKVIVFGRYSIEFFQDTANENFAFSRIESRAQKIGIVGTYAKAESLGTWYFVGNRKEEQSVGIYQLGSGISSKISTREVEKIINSYKQEDLTNIILEATKVDGYNFLILHLPNDTLKFNFIAAEKFGIDYAWSILKTGTENTPYRAINIVSDPRFHLPIVGDRFGSYIGFLTNEVSTQYNQLTEWILFTPYIGIEATAINQIEIETIPGFNATPDATVFMSLTQDGVTFPREYIQLYSNRGEYRTNFIIRRIGYVIQFAGLKFRGVSRSRMAFSMLKINYG